MLIEITNSQSVNAENPYFIALEANDIKRIDLHSAKNSKKRIVYMVELSDTYERGKLGFEIFDTYKEAREFYENLKKIKNN